MFLFIRDIWNRFASSLGARSVARVSVHGWGQRPATMLEALVTVRQQRIPVSRTEHYIKEGHRGVTRSFNRASVSPRRSSSIFPRVIARSSSPFCLAARSIMYPSRRVLLLLLAIVDHIATVLSSPATTYDQRQTGDLNVQVHLKDLQVLALLDKELLDDYTEYDYIYDYADFTIKPISKPSTSTATTPALSVSSATTEKLTEVLDSLTDNSTIALNSTEEATTVPSNAGQSNETLAVSLNENLEHSASEQKILERNDEEVKDSFENDEADATRKSNRGLTDASSKRLPGKRCRSGYTPDGKGRCRRQSQRRLSLIPLAMKLTPRLFDDLIGLNTRNSMQEEDVDRIRTNQASP